MSEGPEDPAARGSAPRAASLDWRSPSVLALVGANLIPMAGVLLLGWSVFSVIFIFWLENVIIGFFNIGKILCARIDPTQAGLAADSPAMRAIGIGGKIFLAAFFTVHYGMFCLVHGVFVFVLFGSKDSIGTPGFEPRFEHARELLSDPGLWLAALGLAASHGISFVSNFLRKGEYQRTTSQAQMMQPYGRIVVLHIAIIASGWVVMAMGAPAAGLLILIVLKVGFDLRAHRREHAKLAGAPEAMED
ncbi:MAG: hypothetical protein JXP34_07745 [Planctomycetes bacterium]|nr:hypothetical protein [Planctomycetota bacterium]